MSDRRGSRRRAAQLLGLLAQLAIVILATDGALAGSCPASQSPPDRVLSRLALYDLERDVAIRSWSRGDPGASAEYAFAAAGPDEQARVLRLSYRLDPTRRAQAGARIELDGL